MILIPQHAELIEQTEGLQGVYDNICKAAATCYQSEAHCGEGAKDFVDKLIARGHTAMLEFGTVYLAMPITTHYSEDINNYIDSPYCKIETSNGYEFKDIFRDLVDCYCITTNLRFIHEHGLYKDLEELSCGLTQWHHKRPCVRLTTSIGIARELCRHRAFSFAQESTRYVNLSKKSNGQCKFIEPSWFNNVDDDAKKSFTLCLGEIERTYNTLINWGCTAQQARDVLPLAAKTEICMCGFDSDWEHFFDLRLYGKTGAPHPDMKVLAQMIKDII